MIIFIVENCYVYKTHPNSISLYPLSSFLGGGGAVLDLFIFLQVFTKLTVINRLTARLTGQKNVKTLKIITLNQSAILDTLAMLNYSNFSSLVFSYCLSLILYFIYTQDF